MVNLTDVTFQASADGANAVMATNDGMMTLTNVDINTAGGSSSAIATDRGGGAITVIGGTVTTSGMNSAAIYSTGAISVSGATMSTNGAEAAVIEGANSIKLTDASLSTSTLVFTSLSCELKSHSSDLLNQTDRHRKIILCVQCDFCQREW